MARQRRTDGAAHGVDVWITREFAMRGLFPPHCTPEALARALERERQITIEFQSHVSDDPGVYGLLYRREGCASTYVIVYRPTQSMALQRITLFHELAHILFHHSLTDVAEVGALRGYMVSDPDDAAAEAFAHGAMYFSLLAGDEPRKPTDVDNDVATSAFGYFLRRTEERP